MKDYKKIYVDYEEQHPRPKAPGPWVGILLLLGMSVILGGGFSALPHLFHESYNPYTFGIGLIDILLWSYLISTLIIKTVIEPQNYKYMLKLQKWADDMYEFGKTHRS